MIGNALDDYKAANKNGVAFLGIAVDPINNYVTFPTGTIVKNEVRL